MQVFTTLNSYTQVMSIIKDNTDKMAYKYEITNFTLDDDKISLNIVFSSTLSTPCHPYCEYDMYHTIFYDIEKNSLGVCK